MPAPPITIELLNSLDRVHVDEPVPLHLLIRCAAETAQAELRHIGSTKPQLAELESDLFERDLQIGPGEVYRCAVSARFRAVGVHHEQLFYVQVGRDKDSHRVRVPTPPIHVVPSFLHELQVHVESICTYEYGTKIEVVVNHKGLTHFDDFRLTIGPDAVIRAGVSEHKRTRFSPSEQLQFTTVVAADHFELTFDAQLQGERMGPVCQRFPVPPVKDSSNSAPFRFLEPKKLTQSDVQIYTFDEVSERVFPRAGFHELSGGGTKYRVEITPAHPQVTSIRLRNVSGSVEVTEIPAKPGTWAFQMVVLMNNVFTTPVVMHYDVSTPEGPQQGELNLAVRPQSSKLWVMAATAGGALTVKGLAAVLPAMVSQVDAWSTFGEAIAKVTSLWDLAQLLCIFIFRGLLSFFDWVVWLFQDK